MDCRREKSILDGLTRLARLLELRGLSSADFIDDGRNLWLLEINPRPGATLDVFDDAADPLMQRHFSASNAPQTRLRTSRGAKASAIVYAEEEIVIPGLEWPSWIADRPPAGTVIPEGAPVCTVHAEGENVSRAKTLLFERVRTALEQTGNSA